MQLIDGALVCSATDLVGYLACGHLTNLERAATAGLVHRPMRADPELDRIAKRGLEHERRFLEGLRAEGCSIVEIREASADVPAPCDTAPGDTAPGDTAPDRGADYRRRADETLAAMREGVDVIYQATFFQPAEGEAGPDGSTPTAWWLGFADFLRRVEAPSDLGPWSYEVWDTKLARHTKASAILQLCLYTDCLERLQGTRPAEMHVALGGSARAVEHHRTADYLAYYRLVRSRFTAALSANTPQFPPPTRPDPVEHCDVCRWVVDCMTWRRAHDDLSLVANITAKQRTALREREPAIPTRRALAAVTLPLDPPIPRRAGVREAGLRTIREQARIQVEGEDAGRTIYELLEPSRLPGGSLEPNRGLLGLPEPSPGDLFLDLEGDPFANDDGVDYLFGVIEPNPPDGDGGLRASDRPGLPATDLPRRPVDLPPADAPAWHAIWAIDPDGEVTPAAEKRAFEALVDLIVDRRRHDPDLHVYHYASYEPTAMGRLSERYHTREDEVDALLRGGVFVDLFRAVRQGIRASVESYSIKKLEPLYGLTREVDLRDAGSSVVAFETWLELGDDEDAQGPEILGRIETYNRDDCVSNWKLRDWLEARRPELAAKLSLDAAALPRPAPEDEEPKEKLSEYLARVAALEARLTADISPDRLADPAAMPPDEHARWLLAQLLAWHRREDKSAWWRYFALLKMTDEELIAESDALGGLVPEGEPRPEKKSMVQRYRFPEQEHDVQPGTDVTDPQTGESPGEVTDVNNVEGWLEIKRGPKKQHTPHPRSLVPLEVVGTPEQRESLLRVGEWVADHGIDADGAYRAARDILLCRPPRFVDAPALHGGAAARTGRVAPGVERVGPDAGPIPADAASLRLPGEHGTDALCRLGPMLDRSYLAVQGPPGSGKTTAGAALIVDLVVAHGRRVGVTANSHKVIGHLLDEVLDEAERRGVAVRVGQKPANGCDPACERARCLESNGELRDALAGREIDVAGATAWAWSREELAGSLDLLVVDEAGQVSLANLVAVAQAASSLVLLGDPQQLDQPLRGSHPPGAERSALGHLLGGAKTMPEHLGLLLESTWRLHPDICAYTSEVFYEGKLRPGEGTEAQALSGPGLLSGTGLRWVPVEHAGNRNASVEEAALICDLLEALRSISGSWVTVKGETKRLGLDDALVITPYNAQVREIASRNRDARVGTVDKFQGQQAPISIYSMATSSADEAPRGMEFLYSLNRLNVASSRARCLALVVASPELIRVQCRTPRQMRLANALARLVEVGEREAGLLHMVAKRQGDDPGTDHSETGDKET